MYTILVANCNKTSSYNLDSSMPDILFFQEGTQEKIAQVKDRLHYNGVEQSGSAILYNASRFTPIKTHQSSVPGIDLQDVTTKKVIRVILPLINSKKEHLLEELNGASDLQIVSAKENFSTLCKLLKPRGFTSEKESGLLVKGEEEIVHVADAELPMTRIELPTSLKPEKKKPSYLSQFISLLKTFLSVLFFKVLVKIVMRYIW